MEREKSAATSRRAANLPGIEMGLTRHTFFPPSCLEDSLVPAWADVGIGRVVPTAVAATEVEAGPFFGLDVFDRLSSLFAFVAIDVVFLRMVLG